MFEICSEFAMISVGGAIERQLCPLLKLIQCALSIAPPIETIANSLQISNIELIFTKYSKPAFYDILVKMIPLNCTICFSKV